MVDLPPRGRVHNIDLAQMHEVWAQRKIEEGRLRETLLEKWKHRIRNSWLVLTGQAWVGHGNPMDWEYIGKD